MPDPLLSSSGKGLISIRIIANEENSIAFLNFCYGYYSVSKNQFIRPPGRSPCGEKFYEDRKKLNSGFLRSFLVLEGAADGLFWLYRRVRKAVCQNGKSRSGPERKKYGWRSRKRNTGSITAHGGRRKSGSRGTGKQWRKTGIRKNPMRNGKRTI